MERKPLLSRCTSAPKAFLQLYDFSSTSYIYTKKLVLSPVPKIAANSRVSDESYGGPSTNKVYSDEEGLAKARRLVEIHRQLGSQRIEEMERLNLSNMCGARSPSPPTKETKLAQ